MMIEFSDFHSNYVANFQVVVITTKVPDDSTPVSDGAPQGDVATDLSSNVSTRL